jgi:DNA-binding beta-propeller fold protein YncE
MDMFAKSIKSAILWMVAVSVAQAGILYVSTNDDDLLTIDTDTLAVGTVGQLGVDFYWSGLAYDPGSDVLYGVDGRAGQFDLYSIDRVTGAATSIGNHGVGELFGLAFDTGTNTLYASQLHGSENLYTIDVQTAQASLVGPLTGSPGIGGLAYDSTRDMLIGWHDFTGDIYSINRATGEATLLADNVDASDGGLAYDPDKDLIWGVDITNGGSLFSLDPANGYALTNDILTSIQGEPVGLAYASGAPSAAPVPALSFWSIALLALVLAGAGLLVGFRQH